jgi:hypothetical protein
MLESPLIDEIVADRAHRHVLTVLETRFGEIPQEVMDAVNSVSDDERLSDLFRKAAACADLDAFRSQIRGK